MCRTIQTIELPIIPRQITRGAFLGDPRTLLWDLFNQILRFPNFLTPSGKFLTSFEITAGYSEQRLGFILCRPAEEGITVPGTCSLR